MNNILLSLLINIFCITTYLNASLFTENQNSAQYLQTMEKFDVNGNFLKDRLLLKKLNSLTTTKKKNIFLKNLDQAYLFVPLLKKKIKAAGIPEEFLYLAMAESNFSPRAYSVKKAAGLWQFMPYTARKFGLRIDDYVDERLDVLKSTDAAIKYLKNLHKRLGKWYLAAMAYNCGEGRVKKAIKRVGSDELQALLRTSKKRRRQYLPSETRNYIRKILSFALIVQETNFFTDNKNAHVLNGGMSTPIVTRDVPPNVHLADVAKVLNMKYKDLRNLNRHLRYSITPPDVRRYQIYIPYSRLVFFNSNKKRIKPNASGFIVHIIKRGNTLYDLAKQYGTTVNMIKLTNNMKHTNLRINKKIIIPTASQHVSQTQDNKIVYHVQSGDTLYKISNIFKIKIKDIIKRNNLSSDIIRVGDKLVMYK
jgi:membrane-bound lytic murein transglycosylase D